VGRKSTWHAPNGLGARTDPDIFSSQGVRAMLEYLAYDKDLSDNAALCMMLVDRLPWKETAMYFTFLEGANLYERFHFELSNSLIGNLVWVKEEFEAWSPAASFSNNNTFYFSVVQAGVGISDDCIQERLEEYLK